MISQTTGTILRLVLACIILQVIEKILTICCKGRRSKKWVGWVSFGVFAVLMCFLDWHYRSWIWPN